MRRYRLLLKQKHSEVFPADCFPQIRLSPRRLMLMPCIKSAKSCGNYSTTNIELISVMLDPSVRLIVQPSLQYFAKEVLFAGSPSCTAA